MIDLSQTCIFSNSTDNLNTTMVVKIDGKEYKVSISDEYEDEAVPSKIKKLVKERVNERDDKLALMQQIAAELGFKVVDPSQTPNQLIIPKKIEEAAKPISATTLEDAPVAKVGKSQFKVQKNTRKQSANKGMTPEEAQAALEAAKRSGQGGQFQSAGSGEAKRYSSHQIPNEIEAVDRRGNKVVARRPEIIAKTNQVVRGREGIPTTIPASLKDDIRGETTITVVDTGGDKTLQKRMEMLNHVAMMKEQGLPANTSDYSQPCRPCRSTGTIRNKSCQSCSGTGFLF